MVSIAKHVYPRKVWRDHKKMLWNPIHKKALKNRPEERVRLRIIEYLLLSGWSKNRISTEEAIRDYNRERLRTDLICYSRDIDPIILVECKAEHISLSSKTAEQVARYNRNIGAPYLLLSNGVRDFWYALSEKENTVKALKNPPEIIGAVEITPREYPYWENRGFAGSKASPDLRSWLLPLLNSYVAEKYPIRYLQFEERPSQLDLNNYYLIHETGQTDSRIALGFMSTPHGESRLIGILNIKGQNKAVAEVNLDRVFEDKAPNTHLYFSRGREELNLLDDFPKFCRISRSSKVLEVTRLLFSSRLS